CPGEGESPSCAGIFTTDAHVTAGKWPEGLILAIGCGQTDARVSHRSQFSGPTSRDPMSMTDGLVIGMDVGSTTVKAVVINPDTKEILWSDYQRHHTKQPEKVLELCEAILAAF